jgi:hypothetical protein
MNKLKRVKRIGNLASSQLIPTDDVSIDNIHIT